MIRLVRSDRCTCRGCVFWDAGRDACEAPLNFWCSDDRYNFIFREGDLRVNGVTVEKSGMSVKKNYPSRRLDRAWQEDKFLNDCI